MYARLPREMLASVVRDLSVPAGTNVIVDALNYASAQLAGYYSWPWFLSECTWSFPAPIIGTATVSGTTVTLVTMSEALTDVDKNWRIQLGVYDYPVTTVGVSSVTLNSAKVDPIESSTPISYILFKASVTMPPDYQPGKDISCYNTLMRYRVRHVNRMAFERHWHSYKQMTSNIPLIYCECEPYFDSAPGGGWRYQLQFCPRPSVNTQVRVSYYRTPTTINLSTNYPTEWPAGYDEAIELLALGRLGEKLGDAKAMMGGKRAQGLIRQLRGGIATAIIDDTPQQNAPYSGASFEEGGLSVLPREV